MCISTLKSQGQNLTSGQGHVRLRFNPDRSCCISVDASRREKRAGLNHTALSLFYQKLEAKNVFELAWPRMKRTRGHWVKSTNGSSKVAWDKTILKWLAWFLSHFWNKKHLNIFSLSYNGLVKKLTWPRVTEIKISRYTICSYWCLYQLLKVSCLSL